MITAELTEVLLVDLSSIAVLIFMYSLLKKAKKFKDYERKIRDYLVIGTLMWLSRTYGFDSSLRNEDMSVTVSFIYYKKGYKGVKVEAGKNKR